MLMASSQMWLTASLLERPRYVIIVKTNYKYTERLIGLFTGVEIFFSFITFIDYHTIRASYDLFLLTNLPLVSLQDNPVTGRKADVLKAAHLCAEAALRLVKPGNQVKLPHHGH